MDWDCQEQGNKKKKRISQICQESKELLILDKRNVCDTDLAHKNIVCTILLLFVNMVCWFYAKIPSKVSSHEYVNVGLKFNLKINA